MNTRTKLMNIEFDNLDLKQAILSIDTIINKKGPKTVFFINADCLYKALYDDSYKDLLQKCDLLLPDGIGLDLAGRFHGLKNIKNCNGTDFSPKLMEYAAEKGYSIYLLGGKNNTSRRAGKTFQKMIPGLNIAGTSSGYQEDWEAVIQDIKKSKARFLFVGMGAPLQEIWINRYKEKLPNLVLLGVGGLFDYFSGNVPRAPQVIRKMKLEWLWRVTHEPKRLFKRYFIDGMKFMKIALSTSAKKRKNSHHQ